MSISRRQFLRIAVVSAASASLGATASQAATPAADRDLSAAPVAPKINRFRFPQSVASGDPKPTSLILWTRVRSESESDVSLRLQVAKDAAFAQLAVDTELLASAEHDHCLKVKVVDLEPYTRYWYRFLYGSNTPVSSPVGRARTAPLADADVPVRFGVVVCQDYIDGYYNAYALLQNRDPDLDFIVHLGDYIYEYDRGTGGAGDDIAARAIRFPDQSPGAWVKADWEQGGKDSKAARSLENYRHLYRVHHGDRMLQRVHERTPMLLIWDDHEFSDDCYGASGTYSNGRIKEYDSERRRNAQQAFFEYLPVDEDFADAIDDTQALDPPLNDTYLSTAKPGRGCWRTLRFGRHLELFLADYRTYRPDHLIPEDAFPGQVALDQAALIALFEAQYPGQGAAIYAAQRGSFSAYTALSSLPAGYADYAAAYAQVLIGVLTQVYLAEGLTATRAKAKAASDLSGPIAVRWFNGLLAQYNATVPPAQQLPPIDSATESTLERGLDYTLLGKTGFFSSVGARYGVVKATYELLAAAKYQGQPEKVLGTKQQAALDRFIATSDASFLGLASSVSTASLVWDLTAVEEFAPIGFNQRFLANVDHWDGFPARRQALLSALQARGKTFVVSGDIHASFLTEWRPDPQNPNAVADFTATSISSTVFNRFVELTVESLSELLNTPEMQAKARELLVDGLDDTLKSGFAGVYPHSALRYALTRENGYAVIAVNADQVQATYRTFPHAQAKTPASSTGAGLTVTTARFRFDGQEIAAI